MDKEQLIRELVAKLLEQSELSSRSSRVARQASIDAPSKMESRYDSTKSEQDWLSHAFALSSMETRKGVQEIQAVNLTPSVMVRIGSIVTVEKEGAQIERYFVLPAGSGKVLQEKSFHRVTVVTPKSPVGLALMGRTAGGSCEVNTPRGFCRLTILSVD